MTIITVNFYNEEPILVTSFQGDPNSDISYSYLPGSAIRGALIGRYLHLYPPLNEDIVDDPAIRRLFFEDSTRFLNAYLYIEELNQRSLPTPQSWRQLKDQENCVIDLSSSEAADDEEESLERVGAKFCSVLPETVYLHQEQRRINIHHNQQDRHNRATKNNKQIYKYESLEKGQTFQAVILCERGEDGQILQQLLGQSPMLRIGGSQTAGYGKVRVSSNIDVSKSSDWQEVDIPVDDRDHSGICRITLLSDVIMCNDSGQYVVEPPTELIADLLRIPMPSQPIIYMNGITVGGFNRKWGLPLPQVCAIAAGSIFVYDNLNLTTEQIQQLEWHGIGERRNEGFGRVAVNWLLDIRKFHIGELQLNSPDEIPPLTKSTQLAREMATRLLRQQLEQMLEQEVNKWRLSGNISNSQLSRLILVVNQALQESNNDLVKNFLNNLKSTAKTQFEGAKISDRSLKQKCLDWLQDAQWLGTDIPSVVIAGETATVNENLRQEYTLRLIRAVAKKFTKATKSKAPEVSI
jgi:CRISPR-associated protein Csx10